MSLFLYTSDLEDFNFIFPFQWICAINNISRQIYLTDNPEVRACFHLSVCSFQLNFLIVLYMALSSTCVEELLSLLFS